MFSLLNVHPDVPAQPPPAALLAKSWHWNILLVLLFATFVLRLITLDVAGAVICAMLLCLGIFLTRDSMRDIGKYCLVYAVLCGLCFFFDILPLIQEISGRVSRHAEPLDPEGEGSTHMRRKVHTYLVTVSRKAFFDRSEGFIYNAESFTMILSPTTMAMGFYLAMHAYLCYIRRDESVVDEPVGGQGLRLAPDRRPEQERDRRQAGHRQRQSSDSSVGSSSRDSLNRPRQQAPTSGNRDRCFRGPAYKLPE